VALGPDLCLTEPRFGALAAFAGFPNVREQESRKWMVESVAIKYEDAESHVQKPWICPSLSAAVTARHVDSAPWWIRWAVQDVFTDDDSRPRVADATASDRAGMKKFLIDYSPLEALEEHSIPSRELSSFVATNSIEGKYILIGRGKLSRDTGDKYPIPGRRADAHCGVYIHACAAYTLLRGPLFVVTNAAKLSWDFLLAFAGIFGIAFVRYRRADRGRPAGDHLPLLFTATVIIFTIGIGFMAVNVTRLMWDGFLLVALSLLVDHSLESKTEPFVERLAAWMPRGWFR
jgi:hypothetical protein